jgi:uncharacterized protein (DUF433 family)
MTRSIVEHIEMTPGVCGGKPRIAGHRIRVQDIVVWTEVHGQSPDEIVASFPRLTLADVHAALAYYYDHRDEINRQMEEDEAFVKAFQARMSSGLPSPPTGKDADENPIPPG